MKFLIFLLIALIIGGSYVTYWAIKFYNPYKLFFVAGKKGSGKSTLITKLGMQHSRKGWTCYSTEHTPGCYYLPPEDLGTVYLPPHSVIFVDEVGLLWHCRDYASFPKYLRNYFKMMRHYGHKVYLFSQSYDVDKSIRDNCDYIYIMRCYLSILSIAQRVNKKLVVVDATGDSESRIAEGLILQPLIFAFFGTAIFTWIPHWAPYFDSFVSDRNDWEYKKFDYVELPKNQWHDLDYIKKKLSKALGIRMKKRRRRRKM